MDMEQNETRNVLLKNMGCRMQGKYKKTDDIVIPKNNLYTVITSLPCSFPISKGTIFLYEDVCLDQFGFPRKNQNFPLKLSFSTESLISSKIGAHLRETKVHFEFIRQKSSDT